VKKVEDPCLLCMVNNQGRYWNCTESCPTKTQYLSMKAAENVSAASHESIRRLNARREELRGDE
jgi:hypothetical protein